MSTSLSFAAKIAEAIWAYSKRYRNTLSNLEEEINKALALHVARLGHENDTEFDRDVLYPRLGSCIKLAISLRKEGTIGSFFSNSLDRAKVAIDDLIAARRHMESQRLSPPPPPAQMPPLHITFVVVNLSHRPAD